MKVLSFLAVVFVLLTAGCTSGPPGSLPATPVASPSPRPSWTPTRVPNTPAPLPTLAFGFTTPTVGAPTVTPTTIGVMPGATSIPPTPSATLVVVPTMTLPFTGTVKVGVGHLLNVRESTGAESAVLGTLTAGQEVQVVGQTTNNKWLQIQTPMQGWVSSDYIALSSGHTITGQMPRAGGYQANIVDTETKVVVIQEPIVSSGNDLVDWLAQLIHQLRTK